jgi:predicted ATPase
LSFGPDTPELPLDNLNVLIGPNGSGKSNFLDALALLRSTIHGASKLGMRFVLRSAGGASEWIWKGNPDEDGTIRAEITGRDGTPAITHRIAIHATSQSLRLSEETVEDQTPRDVLVEHNFSYRFKNGQPTLYTSKDQKRKIDSESFDQELSVLSQFRDPINFPGLAYLTDSYMRMRLFQRWDFGKGFNSPMRIPQMADLPKASLDEDFSNFFIFLNRICQSQKAKRAMESALVFLFEGLDGFEQSIEEGTLLLNFHEGEWSIPASRLSDGSLRFMFLVAILCDPDPPPFIAIEEPEIGLHPDILPKIADLLMEASTRTQLVVTTHSDVLVDALSNHPSSVVVCEKHEGQTTMKRLSADEMAPWLAKYRLGELWSSGEIGGNRW